MFLYNKNVQNYISTIELFRPIKIYYYINIILTFTIFSTILISTYYLTRGLLFHSYCIFKRIKDILYNFLCKNLVKNSNVAQLSNRRNVLYSHRIFRITKCDCAIPTFH